VSIDGTQQQLSDHERRLTRLEDWTEAAKEQIAQQQQQTNQVSGRIDEALDQINRLYRSVIVVGGGLVVALVGTIISLWVR
jgi:predicted  nucleic acid-binding Zn-ribbon protein